MKSSKNTFGLLFSLLFLLALSGITAFYWHPAPIIPENTTAEPVAVENSSAPQPPEPGLVEELGEAEPAPPEESGHRKVEGQIEPGDSFVESLQRLEISEQVRNEIVTTFATCLDFTTLRPHDRFTIVLDENDELFRCDYESGPLATYSLHKSEKGYVAQKNAVPLERQTIVMSGQIESSLLAAFRSQGEDAKLAFSFADIFASQIDFNTELRPGDRFQLFFDKYYKGERFVGYGKIQIARYEHADGKVDEGFQYTPKKATTAYFDAKGRELGTSFLRSPVPYTQVSSEFTPKRLHPILGLVRPHLGIDLAAPAGTPVLAAANGTVVALGYNGGYGNQVVIRHSGGYETHYGHLSRFPKGLHKGSVVSQRQTIGFVGSTGLATGPHLDYRLADNGVFKDPFAVKFKPKSVLQGQELRRFQEVTQQIAAALPPAAELLAHRVVEVENIWLAPDEPVVFL